MHINNVRRDIYIFRSKALLLFLMYGSFLLMLLKFNYSEWIKYQIIFLNDYPWNNSHALPGLLEEHGKAVITLTSIMTCIYSKLAQWMHSSNLRSQINESYLNLVQSIQHRQKSKYITSILTKSSYVSSIEERNMSIIYHVIYTSIKSKQSLNR